MSDIGIVNGEWVGPAVALYKRDFCKCCGWHAPMMNQPSGLCPLCYAANERQKAPLTCQTFCEAPIPTHQRFEPGGLLACESCSDKMRATQERMRKKSAA